MSPEDQRIAIAKSCGWRKHERGWFFHEKIGLGFSNGPLVTKIPDYLHDLNAMHEAEKKCVWQLDRYCDYIDELRLVCKDMYPHCATSTQRAEAFLRTLGLWIKCEKEEG